MSLISNNHYDTLGVSQTAKLNDIKLAYRALSLQYHPDKIQQQQQSTDSTDNNINNNKALIEQKYLAIQQAWSTLSDEKARAAYDKELSAQQQKNLHEEQVHYIYSLDDFEAVVDDDDDELIVFQTICRCTDTICFTSHNLEEYLEKDSTEPFIIPCPGCSLRYQVNNLDE